MDAPGKPLKMDPLVSMIRNGTPEARAAAFAHLNERMAEKRAKRKARLEAEHARYGDGHMCYKRKCQNCGGSFISERRVARNCSRRCASKIALQRRNKRRQVARNRACQQCATPFIARTDAKFCSSKCRQRNYRQNKRNFAPHPICNTHPVSVPQSPSVTGTQKRAGFRARCRILKTSPNLG